jgi:membrane-bound serine protease (ClpP class)
LNAKPTQSRLARRLALAALAGLFLAGGKSRPLFTAEPVPTVVEVDLDQMVNQVSAGYVRSGIQYANQINARAVLLELSTPGGLEGSMRQVIQAIFDSRVPVITYVAPSGTRAASAGFFILLAGDVAVMAPGTNAGAAHPVVLGGAEIGKTMEAKIENDAAAYIRSIAGKRGRNVKMAEAGVRESKSYTEKEALEGHLIDAIANSPQDVLARYDGKNVKRLDDTTTTLRLADARVEPYVMSKRDRFLAWIADPNIAFILGAVGLVCLYIEFTHPGMVAPGVVGAIALILALYAFNLLPINYAGLVLILLALILLALEVKITSHGVLAAGGIVALVIGAMILVSSPWPEGRIRLSTALGVALPLAVITTILLRLAVAAQKRKAVTGEAGMIGSIGVARTDLELEGKVFIHGELWEARAQQKILKGTRVRVRQVEGLTLMVEPVSESR